MHKICHKPFLELNCMSMMSPCCPAWLSTNKFNVIASESSKNASEIWEYDYAEFRNSIINGSYKYCSNTCPHKIALEKGDNQSLDQINPVVYNKVINDESYISNPNHLILCYDITCNLACKSCRPFVLTTQQSNINSLYNFYQPLFKNSTELTISGDGDAFASKHYFSLLQSNLQDASPNLNKLVLQTNGILLNEENFNRIHPNNKKYLNFLSISIDAATEETYKKVRGGNFNTLCNNLEFIKTYKKNNTNWLYLYSNYTITSYNIHEVIDFIDFAYKYDFNMIQFWLARKWDRWVEPKDNMERRYSELDIDFTDQHNKELIHKIQEKINIMKSKLKINWMIDELPDTTTIKYKDNKRMNIKFNDIINHNFLNDESNSGVNLQSISLNNSNPTKRYAIYCPFYISDSNMGYWINNWIDQVSKYEVADKYYTLSYPSNFDISKYNNLIDKLNLVATCIKAEPDIYHTNALEIAHNYLKQYNYEYMLHIEQDVILNTSIGNHLINTLIDTNTDVLITDITHTSISKNRDIDISIFAINLMKYSSDSYSMYVSSEDQQFNPIEMFKYNEGNCTIKIPILNEYSNNQIIKAIDDLSNYVYNTNGLTHWINELIKNNDKYVNIKNPLWVDSARGYPLHAYLNNKLSIIKGISKYAKHLRESRLGTNKSTHTDVDNVINTFGYQPIGTNSPNEHISHIPYNSNGIDIVIISKNQKSSLEQMIKVLKFDIPNAARIFVLDRCTDGSKELLESYNETYIERNDAVGFCAGSARNLGLKHTNPEHDVLFLDGDRIPNNLNYERIIQMLYYFNISMIKNKNDTRSWFVNVPSINTKYDKYNNNVWSSAILLRRTAINEISNIVGNGNIFDPIFDGNWGCEDEYLGDVAYSLGMISGGFPSHIYVDGTTTTSNNTSDEYRNQVEKRNKLRGNLFIQPELLIDNQPYLNKDERRELVNSIVSERRNVIRNMIKHRDRE